MNKSTPVCPECQKPMRKRIRTAENGRKTADWVCMNQVCSYSIYKPWVLLKKEAANMPQSNPLQPVDNSRKTV